MKRAASISATHTAARSFLHAILLPTIEREKRREAATGMRCSSTGRRRSSTAGRLGGGGDPRREQGQGRRLRG
jgi:hypothetical protein